MIEVTKDGYLMALFDDTVIGAFLNNGWQLVERNDSAVKDEYSKTDINRMSIQDLKELAKSYDIEDYEDMKGNQLKNAIIEYLDL